ncbi:MAG TPA: type VI secretion system baseplate subunit TssG [Alphaproteobacteria bacterium]|nr:type VI secretion system baseplate subunit TssG [Alphaproteobacteria bacterium]
MASSRKRSTLTIKESLLLTPQEFELNQALWLLNGLYQNGPKSDKNLVIKSHVHHGPTSTPVVSLKTTENKAYLKISVLSVTSARGPLPLPYLDFIQERVRQKDTKIADFLDLFHTRLTQHWHEIFKISYEHLNTTKKSKSVLEKCVLRLSGRIAQDFSHEDIQTKMLTRFTSLFWHHTKTSAGLKSLLSSFFPFSFEIEAYQGSWSEIKADEQTALGIQKGKFQKLGAHSVLGKRQWNQTKGVTIHLTDLSWKDYITLQTTQEHSPQKDILFLCTRYLGPFVKVLLKLSLKANEEKGFRLNKKWSLGKTTFLRSKLS